MTTTINASTSSGLVNTADTSGVLQLQTANTTAVTIDASQNVGIGTSSPSYKLDVTGQVRANAGSAASALIANSTNAGGTALNVQNSGTVNMLVGGYNSIVGSGNATDVMLSATQGILAFGTGASSTERVRITAAGNVGIGTTTPNLGGDTIACTLSSGTSGSKIARYEIQGTRDDGDNVFAAFDFYQKANLVASILSRKVTGDTGGDLEFSTRTNGGSLTERMRIDSSGNLLVGTTNSDVIGSGANGLSYRASIGNLSVLAASASALAVGRATTTGAMVYFYYNAVAKGSISTDGSNVAYNTSSDYRLKENIVDLPNALTVISQLKPRQFDWKETKETTTGFIAHELSEVMPQAVTGEKDAVDENGKPEYQGIDTSFLVATLTAAIQEQQALITNLTTRLAALEGAK